MFTITCSLSHAEFGFYFLLGASRTNIAVSTDVGRADSGVISDSKRCDDNGIGLESNRRLGIVVADPSHVIRFFPNAIVACARRPKSFSPYIHLFILHPSHPALRFIDSALRDPFADFDTTCKLFSGVLGIRSRQLATRAAFTAFGQAHLGDGHP